MEKTLREMMEEMWRDTACQIPLRLCRWISLENIHGHVLYIRPTRGTRNEKD